MPKLDGTGPLGRGPLTGRGRGICGIGLHNLGGKKSRALGMLFLAVPAVTAVITDARKPNGITRRLYSAIRGRLTGTPGQKAVTGSSVIYIEDGQKK